MDSPQDQDSDDKIQRSIFGGIRVRNLTPSKSMRSPSRNFMDIWSTKHEADKRKRGGIQRFFDGEKKPSAAQTLVTPVSLEEATNAKVYQSVATWLRENETVVESRARLPQGNLQRHTMHQFYDNVYDSIDQQDNQVTSELEQLDLRIPRREAEERMNSTLHQAKNDTRIVQKSSNSTVHHGGSVFDALLVVGPDITDLSISHDLEGKFEPVVCHTFPSHMVYESIQHFCFPMGIQLIAEDDRPTSSNSSETDSDVDNESKLVDSFFVFVLSGGGRDGQDVQYACCLRKWVRVPNHVLIQPHGAIYAPLTYCILAKTPFIPFFRGILEQVLDLHIQELDRMPNLWFDLSTIMPPQHTSWLDEKLHELSTFQTENACQVVDSVFNTMTPLDRQRRRPSLDCMAVDNSAELLMEWALPVVLSSVTWDTLLSVVAGLLTEMKVLVICEDMELLTASVLAIVSLLSPFVWTGPLIAVLPSTLLEYLEAPVPYVIGVASIPRSFHMCSDTIQFYPLSNRLESLVPNMSMPETDKLKAALTSISVCPSPNYLVQYIECIRKNMKGIINQCNDHHDPEDFLTKVQSTQLYSTYKQRKLMRDGATRQLKLEPKAPVIPRMSIAEIDNQEEPPSLQECISTIIHLAFHGEQPLKCAIKPPLSDSAIPLPKATSALEKLRAMCATEAPPPSSIKKKKQKASPKQKKSLSTPSPKPKQGTVTLVIRKESSTLPSSAAPTVKPIISPQIEVPPTIPKQQQLVLTKISTQITLLEPAPTPDTEEKHEMPPSSSESLDPPAFVRVASAQKIQRRFRQWSEGHRMVSRFNTSPIKSLTETHRSSETMAHAIARLHEGFLVSKLGRHGTWGRRRLFCDVGGQHLQWEKRNAKSPSKPHDSTIPFDNITSVTPGNTSNTKSVGSYFTTESDDKEVCFTIHSSVGPRYTIVFKCDTMRDRVNVMNNIQTILPKKLPVYAAKTLGIVEGERVLLALFSQQLQEGIKVKKHGGQGQPQSKLLTCDPSCSELTWRAAKTRHWLKRSSSTSSDDGKQVILVKDITDIKIIGSVNPSRSFQSPSNERISITSTNRTLEFSTEIPEDLQRVLVGLRLLVRLVQNSKDLRAN